MTEQHTIDDTIQTAESFNGKTVSKIEQSSTSLENQYDCASQ